MIHYLFSFWLKNKIIIIIIVGSCIALMSVRFDPLGAPDYYPGFSTAAIMFTPLQLIFFFRGGGAFSGRGRGGGGGGLKISFAPQFCRLEGGGGRL